MLFEWWRNRRRRKLEQEPFPAEWLKTVQRNCRHFAALTPPEKSRLLRYTHWFVSEKSIEAALGLALTDEMKVTIAAHASLLSLGFESPAFDRLISVIIKPEIYSATRIHQPQIGVEIHTEETRMGEAWRNGPVLLSWPDILRQCRDAPDGRNVILHEFAHLLDMVDAIADGVPELESEQQYQTWLQVTRAEYRRLVHHAQLGRQTLLDWYGATNEAEFFAVATECFFERSVELRDVHPALYAVLSAFYKQDPARRWRSLVA